VDPGRYRDLDALRRAAAQAPGDAAARAALAAGQLVRGAGDDAKREAEAALTLDAHAPVARFVLAEIALAQRDAAGADAHLADLLAHGHEGYEVRLLAARAALARQDRAAARTHLEAATRVDAERPEAWQGLRDLARERRDAVGLVAALERLAMIDQHDREGTAELLTALAAANRWSDLVPAGERALFVEPGRAETHRLLGEAYVRTNQPREGLVELDQALRLVPEQPGPIHLARARALVALRRPAEARAAADAAVRADAALAAEAQGIVGGR